MSISHCDACNKFRPGSSGTDATGSEGFFCHVCRGDELDPYCEIEDEIETVQNRLHRLIAKAETGAQWAAICAIEAKELAPLLNLRTVASRQRLDGLMTRFMAAPAPAIEEYEITLQRVGAEMMDDGPAIMRAFDAAIADIKNWVEG